MLKIASEVTLLPKKRIFLKILNFVPSFVECKVSLFDGMCAFQLIIPFLTSVSPLEKTKLFSNVTRMSLSQPAGAWCEKFESDELLGFWLLVPGVMLVAPASWKPPYYYFFLLRRSATKVA
jgi:hypothetical protein